MAKRNAVTPLDPWKSVKQCAEAAGVTTRTLYNWIDSGKLKAYRTPGGRHFRIRESDLEAAMSPVPAGEAWS